MALLVVLVQSSVVGLQLDRVAPNPSCVLKQRYHRRQNEIRPVSNSKFVVP